MKKTFKVLILLLLCWSSGLAIALKGQHSASSNQPMELSSDPMIDLEEPVFRQEFTDSFERASLAPWITSHIPAGGLHDWAIRDTLDTYGPGTCAASGYRYPGYPPNDIAAYINGGNPGWKSWITSPTIDVTGWSVCFLSFSIWTDLEGVTDNFDGGYVEISSDNGTTWQQIDSVAQGQHLDPTYDHRLCDSGQSGFRWAYCYDYQYWRSVVTQNLFLLGYCSAGDQVKLQFVFDRDAYTGGQGYFIDDVTLSETAPPDNQPPVITHTPLTDTSDWQNPYTVSAEVIDYLTGVNPDSVYLYYRIEDGVWVNEKMTNVGANTHEAAIPPQNWHTDIYYYIEATDVASPPNTATTEIYTFEITNARWIIYDENGPGFTPCEGIAPGNGMFNHFILGNVGIDKGFLHKVMLYFDSPGIFDLYIYQWNGLEPGEVLDSLVGLTATRHWTTIETDDLNIIVEESVVVGYICRVSDEDTARVMYDWTMEYPLVLWGWINNQWEQTPSTIGDLMLRLKVIPYNNYIMEESGDYHNVMFSLNQAVPNPMQNNTVIEFQIPTTQNISLRVYDVSGQLVKTLVHAPIAAGVYRITWDGSDEHNKSVASGVYFYRFQGETDDITRKLVITR